MIETIGTKLVRLVKDLPDAGLYKGYIGTVLGKKDRYVHVEFALSQDRKECILLDQTHLETVRLSETLNTI